MITFLATLAGQEKPSPFGQEKAQPEFSGLNGGPCRDRDPFCAELQKAQDRENAFNRAQAELETKLQRLSPCGPEITSVIHETRDLAFDAFAVRGQYLKLWRDMAEADAVRFAKLVATRGGLRTELQKNLVEMQHDLDDLRTRQATLAKSLDSNGVGSEGQQGAFLRQIEENKLERLKNLAGTLTKWERAQRLYENARSNSEQLAQVIAAIQDVVESVSGLWKAYYDGLEAHTSLRCTEIRRGGPRISPMPKPPE
jgi:hypothetical protein